MDTSGTQKEQVKGLRPKTFKRANSPYKRYDDTEPIDSYDLPSKDDAMRELGNEGSLQQVKDKKGNLLRELTSVNRKRLSGTYENDEEDEYKKASEGVPRRYGNLDDVNLPVEKSKKRVKGLK